MGQECGGQADLGANVGVCVTFTHTAPPRWLPNSQQDNNGVMSALILP